MTEITDSQASPYMLWQDRPDASARFVVCAMFTNGYRPKAERLAASLKKFGLPYALFEVPSVHRSISVKGSDDLIYSKPRFIDFALRRFERPVLYLDADVYFCEQPRLIASLGDDGIDFAVYNWFSDLMNDAWIPCENQPTQRANSPARFWRFGYSVDGFSETQLYCSGGVQYWNKSAASLLFLEDWHRALIKFPKSPDDECLQFAFNMTPAEKRNLRHHWLPKEYARYGHWITTPPVINHPDVPNRYNLDHFKTLELKSIDMTKVVPAVGKARLFPRGGIIDVAEKVLLMPSPDGKYAPVSRLTMPFFLETPM